MPWYFLCVIDDKDAMMNYIKDKHQYTSVKGSKMTITYKTPKPKL